MSNTQDTNSQGQAEPSESLKDAVQNKISSTPAKDALGDGSLDDVSGGLWPYVMSSNTYNKTI
ncbi:hypothetical protein QA649_33600 [Bradyrhizobium sp. CB1717]|uniref:hypothetical protein n=1 Tax=Bradyrhizobium sp. CB1717 TaxID=3039154 RepID=UPI0024B1C80A|nr:hypothetical protein [Bradyrhizobium sp. CB1717]WFU22980.1 hypothetical protein QA649_33600 [Bradyrhizobium sp. CB1717]